MGRLQARTPLDAQIRGFTTTAERALTSALRLCRQSRQKPGADQSRILRVERDLARVLAALNGVGQVGRLLDTSQDPDLNAEALERWRQERNLPPSTETELDTDSDTDNDFDISTDTGSVEGGVE